MKEKENLNFIVYAVHYIFHFIVQTLPEHCEFESHSGRLYSIQHYVIQFLSHLRLFSLISSTNKTDPHDIT
jgi:hypothetical protein